MTIKALETVYKGVRFRSRLEARWAMYFEQCAIRWKYEPEGFQVDGDNYLPDFRIQLERWGQKTQHYVEVKSDHVFPKKVPNVYFAGSMKHAFDDQQEYDYEPTNDWRYKEVPILVGGKHADIMLDWENPRGWVTEETKVPIPGAAANYVGPFFYEWGGGHRQATFTDGEHGNSSEGWLERAAIWSKCRYTIEHYCDMFCAYINTPDCYGTLIELGWAMAYKKRIQIWFGPDVDPEDFWFARGRSWLIGPAPVPRGQIWSTFLSKLPKFEPDVRKAARFMEHVSGCIVFGQPGEHVVWGPFDGRADHRFYDILRYALSNRDSAAAVRRHRFA